MISISSLLWQAEIKQHNPTDFGSRQPAGVATNPAGSEVQDLLEDLLDPGNGGCLSAAPAQKSECLFLFFLICPVCTIGVLVTWLVC